MGIVPHVVISVSGLWRYVPIRWHEGSTSEVDILVGILVVCVVLECSFIVNTTLLPGCLPVLGPSE